MYKIVAEVGNRPATTFRLPVVAASPPSGPLGHRLSSRRPRSDHAAAMELGEALGVVAEKAPVDLIVVLSERRRGDEIARGVLREDDGHADRPQTFDLPELGVQYRPRLTARHHPGLDHALGPAADGGDGHPAFGQ